MASIRFYYHQGYYHKQKSSDLSEKVNNQQETGSARADCYVCQQGKMLHQLAAVPLLPSHHHYRPISLKKSGETQKHTYAKLKHTPRYEVRCFVCYLTDRSHSTPAYFEDGFPKLTKNFGLVPPLGAALAVRKIAGATGGHLRSKPVSLLPGNAAGIRRLEHVCRIAVAFMAVDYLSHSGAHVVAPFVALPDR